MGYFFVSFEVYGKQIEFVKLNSNIYEEINLRWGGCGENFLIYCQILGLNVDGQKVKYFGELGFSNVMSVIFILK